MPLDDMLEHARTKNFFSVKSPYRHLYAQPFQPQTTRRLVPPNPGLASRV